MANEKTMTETDAEALHAALYQTHWALMRARDLLNSGLLPVQKAEQRNREHRTTLLKWEADMRAARDSLDGLIKQNLDFWHSVKSVTGCDGSCTAQQSSEAQ